jgi:MFS family permease
VRDRSFWLLALPFFICGYTTNGLIGTHFVKFLDDDGLQTTVIAGALAVMGAANAVGALAAGVLADRWGRARLLAWIYGSRGISLLLMLLTGNPLLITLLSGYYGLVDFATVPPTASLTADIFGRRGLGTAFAWIALAHQVGGATSSLVAGLLVDWTGSYVPVFILSALLLGVAVWLSGVLRSREPVAGAGQAAAVAPAGR